MLSHFLPIGVSLINQLFLVLHHRLLLLSLLFLLIKDASEKTRLVKQGLAVVFDWQGVREFHP